ncbi:hypothetical protein FJZ22_00805 [Candidatus Pacearchaeota archaeon]|nr:hypothetical protein [Candidatus Pacearchaeota archaeon]
MSQSPTSFESLYRRDQHLIKNGEQKYTDAEFYEKHRRVIQELKRVVLHRKFLSAKEHYITALILHHAMNVQDNKQAQIHEYNARKKGYRKHVHLKAQLIDKSLMLRKKKQIYGTQAYRTKAGILKQWPTEKSTITDNQRYELGLPSFQALKKHIES